MSAIEDMSTIVFKFYFTGDLLTCPRFTPTSKNVKR